MSTTASMNRIVIPAMPVARWSQQHAGVIQFAKLVAAVPASGLAAWLFASLIAVSFDGGYFLMNELAGQPDSAQATVAAMAQIFVIMPLAFSMVFGFLKTFLKGTAHWNAAPAVVASVIYVTLLLSEGGVSECFAMAPWVILAAVVAGLGVLCGSRLAAANVSGTRSILIAAVACLPVAAVYWFAAGLECHLEMIMVGCTLFGASAIICANQSLESHGQRVRQCAVAFAPVLIPLFINVAATLVSLPLGAPLGWRAFASAAMIVALSVLSIGAGASVKRH